MGNLISKVSVIKREPVKLSESSKPVKSDGFKWKDQYGKFWDLADMRTDHLYYVIRMVWNHSAPDHLKLKPYKSYKFGNYYSVEYIKVAVEHMWKELSTRPNLTYKMKADLSFMENAYRRRLFRQRPHK